MTDDRTRATPPPAASATGADSAAPVSTQLRTVALCDLVDSTALVERLGDRRAAELFRRHDRIARDLLYRHHGREIDKTDGFLALFERPIHAVAFALDYQRALRDLAAEERVGLNARVGVHVGDVLLWQNEADDIAKGAKQMEVEGLAKPMAARLMHLARPGQILLSGMAHNLASRAQDELGPLAGRVRWPTHGRYRFKGLPSPLLVHEVGEVGIAPLRAPPSSSKAQRDMPLWRQPRALAVEAALGIAAVLTLVFVLAGRPEPAIAFGERDWVVVGDLRNLTGDPTVEDALETAFRISLEQSRFVNVVPDLKLRDALARMQQPGETLVDRDTGSEIALREGAQALILPTVAEIGGRIRVSAEIVDPHTQTTIYAEAADGIGMQSSLGSMDRVAARLRHSLGETLQSIERDSQPLPQVTSGNLEALKAFAAAEKAYFDTRLADARAHFTRALELDPAFALAHLGLARLAHNGGDYEQLARHVANAVAHRDRLTARDALYLDAWALMPTDPLQSASKWRLLNEIYPDMPAGPYNFSLLAWELATGYESAVKTLAEIDAGSNAQRAETAYLRAVLLTAMDRLDEAAAVFQRADVIDVSDRAISPSLLYLAQGKPEQAQAAFDAGMESGDVAADAERTLFALIAAVDRGDFARATSAMEQVRTAGAAAPPATRRRVNLTAAGSSLVLLPPQDVHAALQESAAAYREALASKEPMAFDAAHGLAVAAWLAQRNGNHGDAVAWANEARAAAGNIELPPVEQLLAMVEAAALARDGDAGRAVELLQEEVDGSELYQLHVALLQAQRAAGDNEAALATAEWLQTHRGRALGEYGAGRLVPVNAADARLAGLDAAELLHALGRAADARARLATFLATWPAAEEHPRIAPRIAALRTALDGQPVATAGTP